MSNVHERYWRQLDLLNPELLERTEVTLIGAGGIGSPTALALAKMGVNKLTVYDPDTIEEHNLPNQFYPLEVQSGAGFFSVIDSNKVHILGDMVNLFSDTVFNGISHKYESQPLNGIVISGVDSMSARKTIWEGVKEHKDVVDLYIEARMGAEVGLVYTINPKDAEQSNWYESNMLYDDVNALELPCTARSIIYNTMMIASLICRQVKAHLVGQYKPLEIIFDMQNMVLMATQEQPDG